MNKLIIFFLINFGITFSNPSDQDSIFQALKNKDINTMTEREYDLYKTLIQNESKDITEKEPISKPIPTKVPEKPVSSPEQRKNLINFGFGVSIPLGEYSEIEGDNSGGAENGFTYHLDYGRLINKYVGFLLTIHGANNKFNVGGVVNQLASEFPEVSWEIEANSYRITYLLGGLIYSIPMANSRISFNALLGSASASTPDITIIASDDVDYLEVKQKSVSSGSIAFSLGAKIDFFITPSKTFFLNTRYFYSDHNFEVEAEINGLKEKSHESHVITILTISGGMSFWL